MGKLTVKIKVKKAIFDYEKMQGELTYELLGKEKTHVFKITEDKTLDDIDCSELLGNLFMPETMKIVK